ncbi:MAG: hypothetical protein IJ746_03245 [Ruminococcus sp.]|nr:hypothetical protein [Ruminococcus sp.]
MRYVFSDILRMARGQRLPVVLLVLNVVVSCLVICFSYGLYQSYNVVIKQGRSGRYMELALAAPQGTTHYSEEFDVMQSDITLGDVTDMLCSLDGDTAENIKAINLFVGFYNNIFCFGENGVITSDVGIYSGYFHIRPKGGSIVAAGIDEGFISDEDYIAGRRVVAVGEEMDAPEGRGSVDGGWGRSLMGEKYAMIAGEQFELLRMPKGSLQSRLIVPLTALPRDTKVWVPFGPGSPLMELYFEKPLTMSQYGELSRAVGAYFGDSAGLPKLEFTPAEELYYYKTVMLISVVISLLAAINMAVLYQYILERRSRELAVFRLCGCGRGRAVMMYLSECLLVSLPLFALSEYLWHRLLMPRAAELFEHFESAYSFKLYAAVFGIYAASVTAVMWLMIAFTVRKHSLIELKDRGDRAFGVFRLLEVAQLSAVLVLCLAVSFACLSRYELYAPFADMLEGSGYAVNYQGSFMYADDLRKSMKGAKVSATCLLSFVPEGYDADSDEDSMYQTVAYDNDLIDRYTPKLSEGTWLNKTEHSYLGDKMIPVVAAPNSAFSVGDRLISPDNMIEWDENYVPTRIEDLCFIVVGKLEDSASVFSYPYLMGDYTDHRDLYGVYNTEFVDTEVMFIREQDIYDLYGFNAPIMGTQLVDCKSLSDEEYKEIEMVIKRMSGAQYISFEEMNKASRAYIFEQMKTVFPIALCIFVLTLISGISISAIRTKRRLHTYAVLYICGATRKSCVLRSLWAGLMTCGASVLLAALTVIVGKQTFMKETVIGFGAIPLAVCTGVLAVYLVLSMVMPLLIIGRATIKEQLSEKE